MSATTSPSSDTFMMSGEVMLKLNINGESEHNNHTEINSQRNGNGLGIVKQSSQPLAPGESHLSHTSDDILEEMNSLKLNRQCDNLLTTNTQPKNDAHRHNPVPNDNHSTSTAVSNGNTGKVDEPSAQRLAKRLYNLDGFKRSDVAYHLTRE